MEGGFVSGPTFMSPDLMSGCIAVLFEYCQKTGKDQVSSDHLIELHDLPKPWKGCGGIDRIRPDPGPPPPSPRNALSSMLGGSMVVNFPTLAEARLGDLFF